VARPIASYPRACTSFLPKNLDADWLEETMLAAALSLALAAAAAQGKANPVSDDWYPNVECTLAHPAGCADSIEFITNDPEFQAALHRFFAGRRFERELLAHGLTEVIGRSGKMHTGQQDSDVFLFGGCYPMLCWEQGAVLVAPGRILGAVFTYDCPHCASKTLTIFIRRSSPEDYRWMRMLWRWAYQEAWERRFRSPPYERVRLRVLLEEGDRAPH
jgi:hypothetical protein